MDARASSCRFVLLFALVFAGGCIQPPCEETYSPIVKLLVGIPIPMYITMGLAAVLMVGINDLRRRTMRLPRGGLAAVAAACALPPAFGYLAGPDGWLVSWLMLLALAAILSLRDQGTDPKEQSWLLCLSGALQPSAGDRIGAGFLSCSLVFVVLVGSLITSCSVDGAGKRCGTAESRRPSPGSADSKSN